MIPAFVAALAHEARRFGATVVIRECGYGHDHVDIFDAPDHLVIRLWDAGYRPSEFVADCWRWCAADDDRPTTPPPKP